MSLTCNSPFWRIYVNIRLSILLFGGQRKNQFDNLLLIGGPKGLAELVLLGRLPLGNVGEDGVRLQHLVNVGFAR